MSDLCLCAQILICAHRCLICAPVRTRVCLCAQAACARPRAVARIARTPAPMPAQARVAPPSDKARACHFSHFPACSVRTACDEDGSGAWSEPNPGALGPVESNRTAPSPHATNPLPRRPAASPSLTARRRPVVLCHRWSAIGPRTSAVRLKPGAVRVHDACARALAAAR
jgi:hypothetical protein